MNRFDRSIKHFKRATEGLNNNLKMHALDIWFECVFHDQRHKFDMPEEYQLFEWIEKLEEYNG